MRFFRDFGFGLRTYSEAIHYIFKKRLAWFFLFPLLLNIFLFWVGWDYIYSNDIGEVIRYTNDIFEKTSDVAAA